MTSPTEPPDSPAAVDAPKAHFRLRHPDGTVESDTLTALVAALVGNGYADLPPSSNGDEQALLARWQQSVTTANQVQAVLTGSAVQAGTIDVAKAGEEVLTPLFADRLHPVELDEWTVPVPLVLICTDYAPFTDNTPPTGNICWINPHTERTYLDTLASLGVVEFEMNEDPAA